MARYMVTLVNGTIGKLRAMVLTKFTERGSHSVCSFNLMILMQVKIRGTQKITLEMYIVIDNMWTPLESVSYVLKRWKASNQQVRRTQFPLVPAGSITVQKSQGATMDRIIVHLTSHFKRAMLYVACSSARTANLLFIVSEHGFTPPVLAQ